MGYDKATSVPSCKLRITEQIMKITAQIWTLVKALFERIAARFAILNQPQGNINLKAAPRPRATLE